MSELSSMLYLSIENEPFDSISFDLLVTNARIQNKKHNITGFLYYKQKHFFQYVEGPTMNIKNLLNNLKKDPRHTVLKTIHNNQLSSRRFIHWDMGSLKTNELIQIKFEDVIIDNLFWTKDQGNSGFMEDHTRIWRILDKLAYHRNKGSLSSN